MKISHRIYKLHDDIDELESDIRAEVSDSGLSEAKLNPILRKLDRLLAVNSRLDKVAREAD